MHRPINLVKLLRGTQDSPEQKKSTFFVTYEALLSNRDSEFKYKEGEVASLVAFACGCLSHGVPESCLDGFAFSYPIPHVPKEMDLLKVGENRVLDIELKSRKVGEEKVKKQLTRNRYYLSFLGRGITCLCYTSEDDSWLRLVDEEVLPATWDDAVQFLYEAADFDPSLDFDALFDPSNYSISPVMNRDAFLAGKYFLTDQQEETKRSVLKYLEVEDSGGHLVMGEAGTGKSLLLYDIALTMARQTGRPALIFHGAGLSPEHYAFNRECHDITLLGPQYLMIANVSQYCLVGFDEAHRMYPNGFRRAIQAANDAEVPFLVMLDSGQEMSHREQANDIESIAKELIPVERHIVTLSKKLRSNAKVASYIEALVNGARCNVRNRDGISLEFAPRDEVALQLVELYQKNGYQFIPISPSMYKSSHLNTFQIGGCPNTHGVIGLEYDSVVMVVTDCIRFDGERLCDGPHPNENLLPTKLLYQGLTRARERIAIIFRCDWSVFEYAVGLLAS